MPLKTLRLGSPPDRAFMQINIEHPESNIRGVLYTFLDSWPGQQELLGFTFSVRLCEPDCGQQDDEQHHKEHNAACTG